MSRADDDTHRAAAEHLRRRLGQPRPRGALPVLPRPGETVGGVAFERVPGGKGANQAVACARLGAAVRMVAAVGRDVFADEALAGLRAAGVELDLRIVDAPTGVALITVDAAGETTIVVVPGANEELTDFELPPPTRCCASRRYPTKP